MVLAVLSGPCLQLDGSIKSGQTMFQRYDMDLNGKLNQQDYYDMMLELNLALAVQDYQHFVDNTFNYAGKARHKTAANDDLCLVQPFSSRMLAAGIS